MARSLRHLSLDPSTDVRATFCDTLPIVVFSSPSASIFISSALFRWPLTATFGVSSAAQHRQAAELGGAALTYRLPSVMAPRGFLALCLMLCAFSVYGGERLADGNTPTDHIIALPVAMRLSYKLRAQMTSCIDTDDCERDEKCHFKVSNSNSCREQILVIGFGQGLVEHWTS